jgi:hypothetical protein
LFCHGQGRQKQTEEDVLIGDLSISILPALPGKQVFPGECPPGKKSVVVCVGLWQKRFFKKANKLLLF